jgi:hypothetical protein
MELENSIFISVKKKDSLYFLLCKRKKSDPKNILTRQTITK